MLSRPLSTGLSLLLLVLGVGMISLLLQVNSLVQEQMRKNVRGIDMVVGAKGSPLQLILSSVFHIDNPTGNISLEEARQLTRNRRLVKGGIPLSYGDSYKGYRIVGTTPAYPELYRAELEEGRLWEQPFEVTVGATAARNLNLKIGDTFASSHGLIEGGEVHNEMKFRVVGLFKFSNSVLDQLILSSGESIWQVHNHEEAHEEGEHEEHEEHEEHKEGGSHHEGHHAEEAHEEHHAGEESMPVSKTAAAAEESEREITAMLLQFRSPMALIRMPRMVNQETSMQAAVPSFEINRLFGLLGVGIDTLNAIALVIMLVSGISVFISLYNALRDREYEMALMRTYGASRGQLFILVLQEGLILAFLGFLLGIGASRLGMVLVSDLMASNFNYEVSRFGLMTEELYLLGITLAIGLAASLLPAFRVFRLNISQTLAEG
mgnify:CR=1 FL=1